MSKKEKEPEEGGIDIDLGLGKISFGGVFKGIGNFIDLLSRMVEEGGTEYTRTGEIKDTGSKEMKGVYGFSVKLGGLGGSPKVETFGNIRGDEKRGPVIEEVREPLVDIFDEKDRVCIIAELPGIESKDVKIELKGDVLRIAAESGDRKYSKEIPLPAPVKAENLTHSYKNGILEIEIKK